MNFKSVFAIGIVFLTVFNFFMMIRIQQRSFPLTEEGGKHFTFSNTSKFDLKSIRSISSSKNKSSSPVSFIFIIGLEGTGHHYLSELLSQSPNMLKLKELGICDTTHPLGGVLPMIKLSNATDSSDADSKNMFQILISNMVQIEQTLKNQLHFLDQPTGTSFNIPVNANGCMKNNMASYPFMKGPHRLLQYPNLDMFYDACEQAQLNCKHVYIYRDPYSIISSTTVKRPINRDALEAIQTYTMMLSLIYSQLSYHSYRTSLCFGPLDVHGYKKSEDWDRFSLFFGWDSTETFRRVANVKNNKGEPSSMSQEEKLELVPNKWSQYMKAYFDMHERVIDLCYSSLQSDEE